ncbi:MAG TPA: double-strand break repair helicase AddA [Caulobacteraceae bacterium]|nr:double-strand break repair helicase AddA [Caulobacteraceae bacterium]
MSVDLFEWRQGERPQIRASDPDASVFVAANAGSGKTTTLVNRVARLLLRGARPEAILCVTYTKAAAAEMQRRLFQVLGAWAVMEDAALAERLADLDEPARNLGRARALFAKALETPGGIKITTIHAFCERLLKRFPLEAGVTPGFTVLDDPAAREISVRAREDVAMAALKAPDGPIGRAYAYFSIELDYGRFHDMFAAFEAERQAIGDYVRACEGRGGFGADIWRRCGFSRETPAEEIEAQAVARIRWGGWKRAAEALLQGTPASDRPRGAAMLAMDETTPFADVWTLFATKPGEPRRRLATNAVDAQARAWLSREQTRLSRAAEEAKAARIAAASVHALSLALAYVELYEAAKAALGALDFGDLVQRTRELLTRRADAAWVLFKLDGGLDHVLLDEAQDTAPEQWDILRALTAEFFIDRGAGSRPRTMFAVGDEKQSIFSFQGAAPERLAAEAQAFAAMVGRSGRPFRQTPLLESWRSAPQILRFVDVAFAPPSVAAGLKPAGSEAFPIRHVATRKTPGAVDLWPLEETEPIDEPDPWAPVDAEPPESANKKLARRIALTIDAMVARGEAVADRRTGAPRPMGFGDVLILVRRRGALFHEIIRALKRVGVAVGGADRMLLSEHAAFQDLLALGRFVRFPSDDLTLAALLRSPLCDVGETDLFDLANGREGSLWRELRVRAAERLQWGAAARFLEWARREGDARAPFDFFARVLTRLDEAGGSMKRRFLTRLGREAEDALDAFLAEALAAERRGVLELERFVAEMAASEIEVKREQEDAERPGAGEVRVMTAHGAKGLEAPVVFLPDTTTRATAQGGPLLKAEAGGFLWAPRKAEDCPASSAARAARDQAAEHESLRLLYVALTRARDRLIVCGVKTRPQFFRGSWREVVEDAFGHPDIAADVRTVELDGGGQARRFGPDPGRLAPAPATTDAALTLPSWASRLAPTEPSAARYVAPSRLGEDVRGPAPSPLSRLGGLGRYRRGDIIHRLLQLLPDVAPAGRANAAARLLAREFDLTDEQRAEMAGAALAVLDDARFAAIFGPGSRAEIALAGAARRLPGGVAISGRVDRLLVTDERILVADFKTNRPAPDRIEDADIAYVRQMAVYWAVLQDIFPDRAVEAALIWTDGPKLMPVPENLLARALDEMAASG